METNGLDGGIECSSGIWYCRGWNTLELDFACFDTLFTDLQQELCKAQRRGLLLDYYNAVAPKLRFDPIVPSDLQSAAVTEAAKKVDELIRLCRAKASAGFGSVYEARELILPLIKEGQQ